MNTNKLLAITLFILFLPIKMILSLTNHFSHVLSFKGYALPSSAWKKQRKGVASLFILIILLLLVTISSALPQVSTDKNEYVLGEKVMISINNATNDSVMKIIVNENIYRYMGELNHETEFRPSTTGEHVISLEYDTNKEVKTSFVVNPRADSSSITTIRKVYGPSRITQGIQGIEEQMPVIIGLQEAEGITISKDWLIIRNHEQEIVEKDLDLYDLNSGKKYSAIKNATHNPVGTYDTEIKLDNYPIKKIFFRNLEAKGISNVELRIDDLTYNDEKAGTTSSQFYVIDPTSLNFTEAYVTVTAKGDVLRKCKNWNYTAQKCYGTWEYVMDIIPGQNYTFLLTPEDPAYNETTHDADDCYDESVPGACTGAQVTAISSNGGTTYQFDKNAGSPVRISFENESSTIGTIVDCTVYVDGYDSEGNTWTLQLGNWSTSIWDSAGSGQTAPSPEGTISWGCTSHFGTSNDDALFDDFAVRISTDDRSRPAIAYVDHVYVVINFSIPDTQAPYYSNIVAGPESPATFSPSATYQFNTTWQDNEGVNTTWIEHNFTGTMQNYTFSTHTGDVYYYNYGNIGAGSYVWKMHANDTAGNQNSTMPWQTYTIQKANSQVNLLLNGTSANFTINNSGSANITGILIAGEGDLTIYEEGSQIANGPSPLSTIRTYSSPGNYNITLVYIATQNYSTSTETHFVRVQDTIPPGNVTNLNETEKGQTWILWNWTEPGDSDLDHYEIWVNGSHVDNTSNEYYNVTSLLADTTYEIQVRAVDNWTTPNVGDFVNDTATTEPSADVTPPIISNVLNNSITDSSVNITWDTDEVSDSVVKYGTSSGSYTDTAINTSQLTKHIIHLTGLKPSTMYYYVVNSTDPAGNTNQSKEYNFTTEADGTPPHYSSIIASPSSPATYSPGATYQFNTTWQDSGWIDKVWIEHNFTGTMQNYTYVPNTSSVYYYNYGNIAAGNYVWRMHANDSAGNQNSTMPWQNYKVNKSASQVNLLLNQTGDNISINESQSVNITGILVTGQGNIILYQDAVQINYGPSPLTNITTYNIPGTYNITLTYYATQNYTKSKETHFIIVNDTRAPWINLIDPKNGSTDSDGDVIFKFNVNDTSDVTNCSLYLNGERNKTKEILTKGQNTFTVNNLNNGNYTWYVNCSDPVNHTNISVKWNLTVEINEFFPYIWPETCSDSDGCTVNNINNTPNQWEEHGTLSKSPRYNYVYINFTPSNIPAGSTIHWMYIFYDKYQETTSGWFRLEWRNGTDQNITICTNSYGSDVYHAHDSVNCTFSNETMPTVNRLNSGLELIVTFYYGGTASGKQYGTDETYINLKYTEDVTPPTVELVYPNAYHRPGQVNFTYIPNDKNLVNCTLYGDFTGSWGENLSDTTVVSGQKENFTINLDEGYYTWNVYCCDIAENCAFDEIGGPKNDGNYTVNITNPDLIVNQITFNTSDYLTKEGMNITINATIKNQGNVNVTETFKIQWWIGDPDSGGTQINGNETITGLLVNEEKTVSMSWIIDRGGPRNIYVIVDPPLATNGSVKETKEDNNKNNKTLHVPAYNYFYGQAENNIYLANADNESLYNYLNIANVTGNIFVADEDSTISFSLLQAISRDINNNSVSNDFNDTDTALSMTDYNDSIRKIYTDNTDIPIETMTFTVYTKDINDVPVIDSTNTSNFKTGMLWDKSDEGTQYNGSQDLIFITEINQEQEGKYGTYDYEIRVPVNLKDYLVAGTNVGFYYEII
ncbi:hypothetical protein AYK26_03895 [Euryarchaeota archaeon SM23-78]|nr:MAG: hypothetical protein AYK26_03895 [Euryarchaeota archaeon SM23-78]